MKKIAVFFVFLFFTFPAFSQNAAEPKTLSKKALSTIVKQLKSDDSEIRSYAVEILGKTGNKKLLGIIKKYLADDNRYVRISAVKALWNLGDKDSVKELYSIINDIPPQATGNAPLVELKNIAQNKIREKAIEALTGLIKDKAKDSLLDLKNDNYALIRDVASRELAKMGFAEELDAFFTALSSPDEEIRYQAAQVVARVCPEKISPVLEALKKETAVNTKMFLIEAVKCSPSSKTGLDEILRLADDKNPTIRRKAVEALGEMKSDKAFEKLSKIYMDTPDLNLKLSAMKPLIINEKIRFNYMEIEDALSVADSEAKRKIIDMSGLMNKTYALKMLDKILEDKDPYVQLDASSKILFLVSV